MYKRFLWLCITGITLVVNFAYPQDVKFKNDSLVKDGLNSSYSNSNNTLEFEREGKNLISIIEAPSGNLIDIQNIVNQLIVSGGGVINIPSGHYDWNGGTLRMPDGISLIGAGQNLTFLHQTNFEINRAEINDGIDVPFRISGISFIFYPEGTNSIDRGVGTMVMHNVVNFRIDHCDFIGSVRAIRLTDWENFPNSRGVIDHCNFLSGKSTYSTPYGISVGPTTYGSANRLENIGTENAVFVEDCYFELKTGGSNHPVAAFNGGHYVLRHSTILNSGQCDGHGNGYEYFPLVTNNYRGTKCYEIYDNTFVFEQAGTRTRGYAPFIPRSGGGVFYNNYVENFENMVIFRIDIRNPADAGWDGITYPAPDQIHDFYIWDNIATKIGTTIKIENDLNKLIMENRDYFLRAPAHDLDGFTYTPYIYPHPLVEVTHTNDIKICLGESYFAEGAQQTTSGIYRDTLKAQNGADSIIVTNLTVEVCSGISTTISNEKIRLFPNPSKGEFSLQVDLVTDDIYVEIISNTGRKIFTNQYYNSNNLEIHKIDMSGYPSGIYFIRVLTKNNYKVCKMILKK